MREQKLGRNPTTGDQLMEMLLPVPLPLPEITPDTELDTVPAVSNVERTA